MEAQKKRISPYIYLIIIVLSYLTAGFCQYRLQPILTYMMQGMQIDEGKAGVLVSALSILSIFLAVPFGVMMGKIGPRRTGIFAMILIIAGSLVGVFGTKSYTVMFLSQLVVGAGTCATGILGPYVIACLFAPELRGRANGIYITGGTIAQLVMYNLVPRITTATAWSCSWSGSFSSPTRSHLPWEKPVPARRRSASWKQSGTKTFCSLPLAACSL